MTASLVIFIVCFVIFVIFSFILCEIIIKKKSDEEKSMPDIENGRDASLTVKPPIRKRKFRPEDGLHRSDIHNLSPKMIAVPFNSPDQRKYRRKEFQPMNREFREKRRKKAKRSKREKREGQSDRDKQNNSETDIGGKHNQASEYYSSQVSVCPLAFSEKIYTRNHITETLFAGSIHRGIKG